MAKWRDELADDGQLRIGICWQGNRANPNDCWRSIPLTAFTGLARLPGVRLYSLQMGTGREQIAAPDDPFPMVDLADRLGDLYNTAAILRNFDLVISCDSAPVHLAGALGLPVWLPLSAAPDWRWMLQREDSPWYPTVRLFRQTTLGDWTGVFHRIELAVADLPAGHRHPTRGGSQDRPREGE